MAASKKQQTSISSAHFAALDVGNGECAGISSEVRNPVTFEPLVAPITTKRALDKDSERPGFSLYTGDGETIVFGIDDVYEHGQRDSARRQSGLDRYLGEDYLNFIDVLLLHLFPSMRGRDERITPTLAINLPVSQFNRPEVGEKIKERLEGIRNVRDYEGGILQLDIDPSKIVIMPESTGALMHYAYSPAGEKRGNTDGQTLVVDIGYETTDTTLFVGMKYQRERAHTIPRAGMGNVARAVAEAAGKAIRGVDVSLVDRAMRLLPGKEPADMWLTINGKEFNAARVYAHAIQIEAQKIADAVLTYYQSDVSRVAIAGGGAYHLTAALRDLLPFEQIVRVQNPEHANLIGAYTTLMMKEARK